jgi:hypothetical protein
MFPLNAGCHFYPEDKGRIFLQNSGIIYIVAFEYQWGTYNRPYKVAVHGETHPYKDIRHNMKLSVS